MCSPFIHKLANGLAVLLQVLRKVACQFMHYAVTVTLSSFFQDGLEYLALDVVRDFICIVASAGGRENKPVV